MNRLTNRLPLSCLFVSLYPRIWFAVVCAAALPVCVPCQGAAQEESPFIELFDGNTLSGWKGDPAYWRVEGGALVGEIPRGQTLRHNTWLIWEGGVLSDFELRVQFKLTGAPRANSGIQFRCQAESVNRVSGYQADLDSGATWLGRIYDEHGRALLVERGTRVSLEDDGQRIVERFADPAQFKVLFRESEWNDYRIVACGEHVTVEINGTVFAEMIDRQKSEQDLSGGLAFQLHSGPHTRIEFRNVRYRKLQPGQHRVRVQPEVRGKRQGVVPSAEDGRKLNLGFEDGTLRDWSATGDAFAGQPIKEDTISQRWAGKISGKEGLYFIGGYELPRDGAQGTLTSVPFAVTHPYGSFLFAGGATEDTRVDVILAEPPNEVVFTTHGANREQMTPVYVDLRAHLGKRVFLKLVDESSGGWGHLNFDDFRFHPSMPDQTVTGRSGRLNSSPLLSHLRPNPTSAEGPAAGTIRQMYLEPGFVAEVVAAEPALHQPIAFTFDERGRIWVAEAHSYPEKRLPGEGRDRIVVFEDSDGDGRYESRKLFTAGLNLVSGLEVGFGGVWIGAAPELLFIPDRDRDDRPDGEPEVLLDGFGYQDTHETLNNFIWGPDGWLYGNQGVFNYARIGKPAAPEHERVSLSAGVWRYHPVRHRFEVFAHGGSNQWGLDFSEVGHLFMTHCRSRWGRGLTTHVIQGGHFWNQANRGFAEYVSNSAPPGYPFFRNYLLASARYGHGEGGAGKRGSREVYGGHAHVGTMIYLGDNWPGAYRDRLFTHNLHGHQINQQINRREGSGYNTIHAGRDVLYCADPRYVAVDLKYGPDGAVYIIDWYDQQHCHNPNTELWDRGTGRLYRMTYAPTYKPTSVDLSRASDAELVEWQLHKNEWYGRTARRLLQERAVDRRLAPDTQQRLLHLARSHPDPLVRLRGLWSLHAVAGLDDSVASDLLKDDNENVRAWTIQLLADDQSVSSGLLERFVQMAQEDPSPLVRLYLASAVKRVPLPIGWRLTEALAQNSEDADDRNLPRMIWYGLATLMPHNLDRALDLARETRIPVLKHYVRWYAAKRQGDGLNRMLALLGRQTQEQDVIEAIALALSGQRDLPMPTAWPSVGPQLYQSPNQRVQHLAHNLGSLFGDRTIFPQMRQTLADSEAPLVDRQHAFAILANGPDPESVPLFLTLLDEDSFREEVIGLASRFNHPDTAEALLSRFEAFSGKQKAMAMNTLTRRQSLAIALLDAIVAGRVDRKQLTAFHARQLDSLKSKSVDEKLAKIWGKVTSTPEAQQQRITKLQEKFAEAPLWAFSTAEGRKHFVLLCSPCHQVAGEGVDIGPSLIGSGANGAHYFIENILDPHAVIGTDYQATLIETKDGEFLTGLIEQDTETAVTIRTQLGSVTVPRTNISQLTLAEQSMMPSGLIDDLNDRQQIELLKYLRSL